MNKLYKIIPILLFYFSISAQAANELYVKGQAATIATTTPTLYNNGSLIHVNGDITIEDGLFVNTGINFLELSGNWANNQASGNNKYESDGYERFFGTTDQTISGVMNGTTANNNQFYNLYISKTSTTGEYVSLLNNVHINAAGTLQFSDSYGIIRTQASTTTTPDYTGNYTNELYIQNPSASAIVGHSAGAGATTKYIEGKLRRQANGTDTYFFPIGVGKAGLDGMEAISINMNALSMPSGSTTGLLAYIQPAAIGLYSSDLIANGDVLFYDIGGYDVATNNNNFSQCVSGPEGYDDVALIDQAITHEWIVTPNIAPTSVDYDITVVPGTILENQINYAVMGTPCNTLYPKAQYLARNGRIGGNTSFGPTYIFDVPNVLGLVQAPTLKTITGQDGFSRFRLFGATDDNTSLPVELLSFTLTPINNQYFLLNWETASEFNNAGFYVQRSTDRSNFENIAWIAGNGTTNQAQQYTYADRNVEQNITYYYRLQQIDINHAYKYSNILSGRLIGTAFEVTDVHPNPSTVNPQVDVYAPNNGLLQTSIIDVLGREVGHQNFELNRGINALTLNLSYLAKASYLLRFNYDNHLITKKFIKN